MTRRWAMLLPGWVQVAAPTGRIVLRIVGLAFYLVVFTAAWFGLDTPAANIAPVSLYVVFWVGGPIVAALVGDVWAALNPFDTIAAGWERLRPRPPAARSAGTGADGDDDGNDGDEPGFGYWTAAIGIFSFVWLELAYHDAGLTPSGGGVAHAVLGGQPGRGRALGSGWLRYGEGFAALFGLIAHLAAFFRADDGGLRWRVPLSGLSDVLLRAGLPALVLVTLGSTGYDGLSGTRWWADTIGSRAGLGRHVRGHARAGVGRRRGGRDLVPGLCPRRSDR